MFYRPSTSTSTSSPPRSIRYADSGPAIAHGPNSSPWPKATDSCSASASSIASVSRLVPVAHAESRNEPVDSQEVETAHCIVSRKRNSNDNNPIGRRNPKESQHQVTKVTFDKWQRDYNGDHETLCWLRCELDRESQSHVA